MGVGRKKKKAKASGWYGRLGMLGAKPRVQDTLLCPRKQKLFKKTYGLC